MLALNLVRLIEGHSEQLAVSLATRIRSSQNVTRYKKLPTDELQDIAVEVYRHLGEWLLTKTDAEIESFFTHKARRRAAQGVPLSDMVWVLLTMKENLWRYLQTNASFDRAFELLGELELIQAIDQFFDRGIYYATLEYERGRPAHAVKAS